MRVKNTNKNNREETQCDKKIKKRKGINQGKHDIHLGTKDQLSVTLCVLGNSLAKKKKKKVKLG